ncbi:SH3 domain-containing protein [Phaeocystidibacter marisrubri]|uniref:SH3 domain-containing protein n=1 Tax=Phaeocystidibacter marisrubri TaxID=1577780 RepID=A0A6L3ZIX6_9FLAO|nr:SH3 domain-containing protein [Phaeocystidibacter marisrubri]KAB2817549.1 SH3 domain-containing protein [Phaeocystidibacter marisrubri]GGH74788.1 hypothetical protein GCM10011318_21140 [Phaeocystidibacter marisrubri]
MKHTISILFALLFTLPAWAQEECEFTRTYSISAESGMKMRSQPQAGTPVVTYVMFDSIVEACDISFGQAEFEEIKGDWRRVRYKDKVGYMFDGFLKRMDTLAVPMDTLSMDTLSSDSLPVWSTDSISMVNDSSLVEAIVKDTVYFVWDRTKRDSIPSNGRLDRQQIRALATVLNKTELRRDSLISFLYELPTLGSQDSVIAWIDAGMPGGIQSHQNLSSTEVEAPTTSSPVEETPKGPPPFTIQLATEAYNYCGDINQIDPSMNWYGLFPDEPMGGYFLKRIDLELVVSKTRLGSSMEFDIRNSSGNYAHFLFGVNRLLDTNKFYQLSPERFVHIPPALFPGQQMEAFAQYNRPSAANVFISATGSVVEVGACPVIDNYKMRINTQGPRGEIIQDITPLFGNLGECGMPEMYWFGDLNGDNYPELVYVAANKKKNVFTLLLSNTQLEEGLYTVGSTWTIETCD